MTKFASSSSDNGMHPGVQSIDSIKVKHYSQKPPEGHCPSGGFYVQQAGIEPIAVEPASGRFRPPVRTLGATSIFAKGKNANRSRSPAPKIDKHRQGLVDFYLFTIHYSLFTKIEGSIFGKE